MRMLKLTLGACLLLGGLLATAGVAGALPLSPGAPYTCSGGNVPAGNYSSIKVTGVCYMPAGAINVRGNITVSPGALLDATSPGDPSSSPLVPAILTVGGNVLVGSGAVLLLGCSPNISCPNAITTDSIGGSVLAANSLGVVLHSTSIGGSVSFLGGGNGVAGPASCGVTPAPWSEDPNLAGTPVYSDSEDVTVGGSFVISGLESCWLGALRNQVRGSMVVSNNAMGDPDSMETLNNLIGGSIVCSGNSPAVQFGDGAAAPNLVGGGAVGECGFDVLVPNPGPVAGEGPGVPEHISVSTSALGTYLGSHVTTSSSQTTFGTTEAGNTYVGEMSAVQLLGGGITGSVSELTLASIAPNGSSSFEALDSCASCSFAGQTGSVTLRAYGTTTASGLTTGIFLVASGGAGNGDLATLAGWGTFTSAGQPDGTLALVEHLTIS